MMAGQNRFNPRKLMRSKWTARQPLSIELEAVLTGRCQQLDWQDLHDADTWQQGWK